jgi:hypothetical protein
MYKVLDYSDFYCNISKSIENLLGCIMRRCLIFIFILLIIQFRLFAQVTVNEIVFKNDSLIIVELYNKFLNSVIIHSLTLNSDSIQLTDDFENYEVLPSTLALVEFKFSKELTELNKVSVKINTDTDQYSAEFKGCILKGESAGRFPDFSGEYIVYNSTQISPGYLNKTPGVLVKKTSKTNFSPRDSSPNAALFFKNQYWIFGGWDYNPSSGTYSSKPNVWKSADGLDWVLVNDKPPFSPYSNFVVFKNKMMIYTGDTVFISDDGEIWDKHLCNTFYYENYRFVVFKEKLYVNSFDMMYESDDGINWTMKYTDFPWEKVRYLPGLVSSGDKLWLYGGESGFNDVWNSSDGIHWIKILDKAPWSSRIWFNFTYFDNKLWMIDGNDQNMSDTLNFGNLRDFWYSSDGVKWNLLQTDTIYQNRHGSFLWNDGRRVLISSGFGNMLLSRMYNDVWELNAAVTLKSSKGVDMQSTCINSQINDIKYAIAGADGAIIKGLPEGVNGYYSEGELTIKGNPVESGIFNYTISPTGPFVLPVTSGTITVNPPSEITLKSAELTDSQVLFINTPLKDINYYVTGATEVSIRGLPQGVKGTFNEGIFTISGKSTIPGSFNYTIITKGHCSMSSKSGNINVDLIRIFPNPTKGKISILNINGFSLSIFDISGHQIYFNIFPSEQSVIEKDFSDVLKQDGVYMFVVTEKDTGNIYSQKVICIP